MTLLLAAAISHVLIIGVDGLSSDGVRTAPSRTSHALMQRGAWTLQVTRRHADRQFAQLDVAPLRRRTRNARRSFQ